MASTSVSSQATLPGIADSILAAIGRTPLVRLHRVPPAPQPVFLLKVESTNPGGSIKDRVALAMVKQAEAAGALRPGGTIIEATAGNTGLGLAMVSAVRGYRCIFVLPDKMSADKISLLKAYGAEVVITPTNVPPDSPESYNGVAHRLAREIKDAWRPNQFGNLYNPQSHYEQTGPEIWEQTEGKATVFVSGVGTGGTISGVGRFLKEKNPAIRVIGADIEGSVLSGGSPKAWKVEGIGEDFVPTTLNAQVVDEWIRIGDSESFATARRVAREEGILLGGSSGTAIAAGLRYFQRCSPDDLIVILCADTGRNYLTKMYSDQWMAENGFSDRTPNQVTAGDLVAGLGLEGRLRTASPTDTLLVVADRFREYGFSQMPVVEEGKIVGSIHELMVVRALHQGLSSAETRVAEVMGKPLPSVEEHIQLEEIYRVLLAGNPGVVVTRSGRPIALIARTDLMTFYQLTSRGDRGEERAR